METYLLFVIVIAAVYALLAQSLVVVWGLSGMVNLGLVGFFAIGAYASAIATRDWSFSVPAGLAFAMIVGALVGLVVTLSTLRLRDDYLAIVTLGFAEVVRIVASNEIWLTGGTDGMSAIPSLFDRSQGTAFHAKYAVVAVALCLTALFLIRRLGTSPWGRVLRAIREDQIVAAVAGKPVTIYKAQAFMIGASVAGLAGALYGSYISYIAPDLFQPLITIYVFLAATAGGNTRAWGATIGAFLLVAWLEASRFAGDVLPGVSAVQVASLREISIGLALAIILRFAPGGLLKERNEKAPA